jgi:predicted metal-dependent RNase
MATDKLYTVAGVSKLNGEYKVRFANDTMRIKVLAKHGHEDITLIELPGEMSKLDAVKFLKTVDEFQGASEQSAIADYLDRKDEKPAKAAPKAKAKATAVKAPAKAKRKAQDENTPFGVAEAAVGEALV